MHFIRLSNIKIQQRMQFEALRTITLTDLKNLCVPGFVSNISRVLLFPHQFYPKDLNTHFMKFADFTPAKDYWKNLGNDLGFGFWNYKKKIFNNPDFAQLFLREFHSTMKSLLLIQDQVFNGNEKGMFWKLLPQKVLVVKGQKSAPHWKSYVLIRRERATLKTALKVSTLPLQGFR